MSRLIRIFATIVVGCFGWGASVSAGLEIRFDYGLFAASWTDVEENQRATGLGPLLESAHSPDETELRAVRPFWNRVDNEPKDQHRSEYLWPLATSRRVGAAWNWRWGTAMGFHDDVKSETARYRLWILPLYFQGRDSDGVGYRALFPLGGTLREFIGRDDMRFFLFPLFGQHSVNGVKTTNYVWPIYSKTSGKGIERFRVWPLYGTSKFRDDWEKRFILWPLWTDVKYNYKNGSGGGFILFPLFGHMKLQDQETFWVIPPFFRWTEGEKGNSRINGPWPLYQRSTGATEKLYIFPLVGNKKIGHVSKSFFLWPIASRDTLTRAEHTVTRTYVLPFYQHFKQEANTPEAEDNSYLKIWPLFSWEESVRGRRFRMLELWPVRTHSAIERNWSPIWRLAQYHSLGENSDTEILWGTFRRLKRGPEVYTSLFPFYESTKNREAPTFKAWSVLKGLVGYKRRPEKRELQLLYFLHFPFAHSSVSEEQATP